MIGFRHLSIGRKLSVSFGLIAILVVLLGTFSGYLLHRLNNQITYLTSNVEPSLIHVLTMDVTVSDYRQIQLRQAGFATKEEREQFRASLKTYSANVQSGLNNITQWLTVPHEKAILNELVKQWHQYEALQQSFQELLDEGNNSDARDLMLEEGLPQYDALKKTLSSLEDALNEKNTATAQMATSLFHDSVWQIGGLILVVMVLVLVSAWGLTHQIRTPLRTLLTQAKHIAAGDLAHDMDVSNLNRDEIGTLAVAFKDMQKNLHDLIERLSQTVTDLNVQVETGLKVSKSSASSINSQEQELTYLATAMNQMSATVADVARNTIQAAQDAQHAASEANQGGIVVEQTISAIQGVAEEVDSTTQLVQNLAEDSNKISLVLDVIRGIAEQTNLLALNAAIEAARAGEQGRGFAVVADEVRSLAQRTQHSTQEIQSIIASLQSRSDDAVKAMHRSSEQVKNSVTEARLAGERIQVIANAIHDIADMTNQIASATEEQNSVAEELNKNIDSIHASVSVVADGANQTAASSNSLANLTTQLRQMTMQFQI